MKYLVTGISGFVGQYFAEELLKEGNEVTGLSRNAPDDKLNNYSKFKWIKCDISRQVDLEKIPLHSFDWICHLAAAGVKASTRDWQNCVSTNITGTHNLILSLIRLEKNSGKCPHLLYSKTFYEDHLNTNSLLCSNPYIVTKSAATKMIELFGLGTTSSVVIAKVYQVFGPGDEGGNVLTYAVNAAKAKIAATFGSGTGLRDWIFIEDFINGLVASISDKKQGIVNYDLGSGLLVSVREMVERIFDISGADKDLLTFDPSRDRGDINIIDTAEKFPPNWKPSLSITKAIEKTLNAK